MPSTTPTYAYDNANRLTSVTDAINGVTSYGYDANGNRTSVTNARNKTTTYAYDSLNRLASITDPNNRTTAFQYDAASRLIKRTDGRSLVTKYFYDAASRLTKVERWNSSETTLLDQVTYQYDAVGNRTQMVDPTGTTTYNYDALNRPTSIPPRRLIRSSGRQSGGTPPLPGWPRLDGGPGRPRPPARHLPAEPRPRVGVWTKVCYKIGISLPIPAVRICVHGAP
jgi:YD repeat-containing protein